MAKRRPSWTRRGLERRQGGDVSFGRDIGEGKPRRLPAAWLQRKRDTRRRALADREDAVEDFEPYDKNALISDLLSAVKPDDLAINGDARHRSNATVALAAPKPPTATESLSSKPAPKTPLEPTSLKSLSSSSTLSSSSPSSSSSPLLAPAHASSTSPSVPPLPPLSNSRPSPFPSRDSSTPLQTQSQPPGSRASASYNSAINNYSLSLNGSPLNGHSRHACFTARQGSTVPTISALHKHKVLQRSPNKNVTHTDSLDSFERDLAHVLKTLRAAPLDASIPFSFGTSGNPSFTRTWTDDDWDRHTSRWRFFFYMRTLPKSRLLWRLSPILGVYTAWCLGAAWLFTHPHVSPVLAIPLTPLSLISTFVAALLTLRSNQGLSRLAEGRVAFGQTVLYTRDLAQQVMATVYPKHPVLALKLGRHLSIFGWTLQNFLRGRQSIHGRDEDIVQTMLCEADARFLLNHRKMPVAIVTQCRHILYYLATNDYITHADRLFLDRSIQKLDICITTCERIKASPIPPLYTAHLGRLLLCYLGLLPWALLATGSLQIWGTLATSSVIGYTMLGLDEISHLLEQPFRLMPLYQLCKNSMKDVGDAYCQRVPPVIPNNEYYEPVTPSYWRENEFSF
jgi:ion channel-forming bestrophin family protein